jgi:hypothetical protein
LLCLVYNAEPRQTGQIQNYTSEALSVSWLRYARNQS